MITLYGSPRSSAGRTRWMLEEIGVPYDYHVVKVREGGAKTPEFLAMNPGGKIPFIVDGDVRLAESMAINFYLAEKYKPELLPADLRERALVYQWSFWAITVLQPECLTAMMHRAFLPEPERDPKALESAKRNMESAFDLLEQALGSAYLLGERFSVVDVNAGSVVNLGMRVGVAEGSRPKLERWM